MAKKKSTTCPCGSGMNYSQCCGRFIEQGEFPDTAEQLMRSRYTAYSNMDSDYLLRTWHPSTRPKQFSLNEDAQIKWINLTIQKTRSGGSNDNTGTVEFEARYKINGKAERMRELSHFRKEQNQWFYVSGE